VHATHRRPGSKIPDLALIQHMVIMTNNTQVKKAEQNKRQWLN